MSFSLQTGFRDQPNRPKKWRHDIPMFGKKTHVDAFTNTLGISNVKNQEYIAALHQIRPFIEPHIRSLTEMDLPEGNAYRSSRTKKDLQGNARYVGNDKLHLDIALCDSANETQVSCYLPYLYPLWYAGAKYSSFIYARAGSNYKTITLHDLQQFRFLILTTPLHVLKQTRLKLVDGTVSELTFDMLIKTPDAILGSLNAVTSYDELTALLNDITNVEREPLVMIDSVFIDALIQKCRELFIPLKEVIKVIRKIGIVDNLKRIEQSAWYKILIKILARHNIEQIPDDFVSCTLRCIAYMDILMPLILHEYFLHYISKSIMGLDEATQLHLFHNRAFLSEFETMLNVKPVFTAQEQARIQEIDPSAIVRLSKILAYKNAYHMCKEIIDSRNNYGLMNTDLTLKLLHFFAKWYFRGNLDLLFIQNSPPLSKNRLSSHDPVITNYGKFYRTSTENPDYLVATCINILLYHLYPNNTPAGYYVGQTFQIHVDDVDNLDLYRTMSSEFTLARSINVRDLGTIRHIRNATTGRYDTDVENPDDSPDIDEGGDDLLGGIRKRKQTKKIKCRPPRKTRRRIKKNNK